MYENPAETLPAADAHGSIATFFFYETELITSKVTRSKMNSIILMLKKDFKMT